MEKTDFEYQTIAYMDEDLVLSFRSADVIHVYHMTGYRTPLNGIRRTGWLSAGNWELLESGGYGKSDGIGWKYLATADSIAEIVRIEKSGMNSDS